MLLLTIFSFHFVVVFYILGYLFNYIEFIFRYCVTVSFCIVDFSQGKAIIIILHNSSIFLSFMFYTIKLCSSSQLEQDER